MRVDARFSGGVRRALARAAGARWPGVSLFTVIRRYVLITLALAIMAVLLLLPLVLMGGATLINFSAALTWGIFVGTYSSIYVAASMLLYMPRLRRIEKARV